MIDINIANYIIKIMFINLCTSYIFIKSSYTTKVKKAQYLVLMLNILLVCLIFTFLSKIMDILITFIVSYAIYSIVMKLITKRNLSITILITTICVSISILFIIIASVINFFLLKFIPFYNSATPYIEYIILGLIQVLFTYLFFKIKKFEHGFSFLQKSSNITDMNYIGAIIAIFSLLLCILFGIIQDIKLRTYFTFALIILGFVLYKWIHQQMKKCYQYEVIDKTIKSLKDEIIVLKSKLSNSSKINHNYSYRISALEDAIKVPKAEFAQEITPDLAKSIKNLSKDFRSEYMPAINLTTLPSTNVYAIDNILSYMLQEANKSNIEFNVQINENIKFILPKIILEDKFVTMLANHIQNSIIAINSNNSKSKSILVILGLIDNSYGFCIYDTGIEFQIDTLSKIGLEEITTHKHGSGISFMTTFEIIKEYNASLIIEENDPNISKYTKSITIKFDNKGEYKISSYRANKIKSLCNDSRIKIENK